jgi:hypothetical protein
MQTKQTDDGQGSQQRQLEWVATAWWCEQTTG